jgi:hypothetical protein
MKDDTRIAMASVAFGISSFTLREFHGQLCTSCNWSEKTYVFIDAKTGEKTVV